jgi:hypothetical protein
MAKPPRIFLPFTGQFSGFSVKKYFLEICLKKVSDFLHRALDCYSEQSGIGVISGINRKFSISGQTPRAPGQKKYPTFSKFFFPKKLAHTFYVQKMQNHTDPT